MNWRGSLRRGIPYVVAVVGGFLLAYLIVAFVVFPSGIVPTDVKVPNVIGLTYDEAVSRLRQADFKGERGEERFHASAPKGTVLEQTPAPDARELSGSTVILVVSGGQRMGSVPIVSGMERADAERAIRDAGFDVSEVTSEPSTSPLGAVIGTRPNAGTQMPIPSEVALVVSSGPAVVEAPDVVGRNFAQAQLLLQQVGLSLGSITTETGVPADGAAMVMGQSPAAGSQVARGSRIDLHLRASP